MNTSPHTLRAVPLPDQADRPLAAKKIWEIKQCYKCALIGTCLTRIELRKLGRERLFALESGLNDYQLHAAFIAISDAGDEKGKRLQKYFVRKYRVATKTYLHASNDNAIEHLWKEDLTKGTIDSAWWSVLMHPLVSNELVSRLYGQLHMMGHDLTGNSRQERLLIERQQKRVAMLEEIIGSERQHARSIKRQLLAGQDSLRGALAAQECLQRENARLSLELTERKNQVREMTNARQAGSGQQLIDELRQTNNTLHGRIDQLTGTMEMLTLQLTAAKRQLDELAAIKARMARHEAEQAKEITALEALLVRQGAKAAPCATCADQHTTNCPGLRLCGKTVLYVGGLHKMIPHYRQLVEDSGGTFLHHDGGQESSRRILPKMLISADAVLCPVDCVSHDACNCVKKMCKRYQKPFVPMRTAGLSSLAKGLDEIH